MDEGWGGIETEGRKIHWEVVTGERRWWQGLAGCLGDREGAEKF